METDQISSLLENYQRLVRRVDRHITRITSIFSDQIACRKGCDLCCRFLTLFPVEAMVLSKAFGHLDKELKAKVVRKTETGEDTCPLLIDRECVLYEARPIICRTHGYPIYMEKDGENRIDFCPENFKGVTSFSREMMFDVEQLNTVLAVINRQFIESVAAEPPFPDRIPVSEAVFILQQ